MEATLQATTNSSSANSTTSASDSDKDAKSELDKERVSVGVGAAVGGIVLGASVSIVFFRYSRKKPDLESNPQGNGMPRRSHGISEIARNYPTGNNAPGSDMGVRSYTTYRGGETSTIYPDESASCVRSETSYQLATTYATDFAMADPQIWTEHLQAGPSREPETIPETIPENEAVERMDYGTRMAEIPGGADQFYPFAQPQNRPAG
ncbi:hypothetical protein F5Y06DRAFT_148571 [Hypoxylon sp. FL0890]|nr:hypothetical protein F5Y06DRAFT_148571 [Hypoxylon sp. FL0890]